MLRKNFTLVRSLYFNNSQICSGYQSNYSTNKNLSEIKYSETVIGYPTSSLNLRWLLNDEFTNVAVHNKKVIDSNHPLIKTARNLIFQENLQCFGLIVLLVSKMGGLNTDFPDIERDNSSGILHSQRVLAEVTEMVRMSNLIHRSIIHLDSEQLKKSDLHYGNKIALLTGDYLISNAFKDLANIRNQEVNELLSTALRDLTEAEFLGEKDLQNRPIPCKPKLTDDVIELIDQFEDEPYNYSKALGIAKTEWTIRTLLNGGSLLAKACSCALKLAGHTKETRDNGHLIGKHFLLAVQAKQDEEIINNYLGGEFSLINAPLMFHLQYDPDFYNEIDKDTKNINYEKLREVVFRGPGIEKTKELRTEHVNKTIEILNNFKDNEARGALIKLVDAIRA